MVWLVLELEPSDADHISLARTSSRECPIDSQPAEALLRVSEGLVIAQVGQRARALGRTAAHHEPAIVSPFNDQPYRLWPVDDEPCRRRSHRAGFCNE